MKGQYFDNSRVKSNQENTANPDVLDVTNNEHKNYSECDQTESELTRFIRLSVESSQKYNSNQSLSTIKQVMDISSNAISGIPIFVNHSNHIIRKAVSAGKECIHTITDLKNSLYLSKED